MERPPRPKKPRNSAVLTTRIDLVLDEGLAESRVLFCCWQPTRRFVWDFFPRGVLSRGGTRYNAGDLRVVFLGKRKTRPCDVKLDASRSVPGNTQRFRDDKIALEAEQMKLLRVLVVGMFIASLAVGCGPRNPDTDPKADDLDLKIDEGDSAKE